MSSRPPRLPSLAVAGRTPSVDVTATDADGVSHLEWAAGIARRRAKRYRVREGSAEEDLIVAEAQTSLVRLALRFLPEMVPVGGNADGQFRGWACREVLTAATRECRRLGNAGTYDASSRPRRMRAVPLSRLRVPLPSPSWGEGEEPEPAWSVFDTSGDD